jgi:hypothetical protein
MVFDREGLDALHERDRKRGRIYIGLIAASITVVVATLIYTKWPHPNVTVVGNPYIVGTSLIEQGGTVVWKRQEVCVPEGVTHVYRYAEQLDEEDPRLQLAFDVPGFTITASEKVCFNPSVTPIILPNYIGPGKWQIRVETLTKSPTGSRKVTSTSYGPPFTVVKAKGAKS